MLLWKKSNTGFPPNSGCDAMDLHYTKDVHTEHCCVIHGCKYGQHDTCSVVNERKPQSFICEDCDDAGIEDVSKIKEYLDMRKISTSTEEGICEAERQNLSRWTEKDFRELPEFAKQAIRKYEVTLSQAGS